MHKDLSDLRYPDPIRHSDTSGFTLSRSMKQRWINALRSGKYKKGRGRLYNKQRNTFCCLGVLCDLLGADRDKMDKASMPGCIDMFKDIDFSVGAKNSDLRGLAGLNDNGASFEKIAAMIKKYVPTHD